MNHYEFERNCMVIAITCAAISLGIAIGLVILAVS